MDNKTVKTGVKPAKETQYSYSRIEKLLQCPYRYKLTYEDHLYVSETGIAAYVGTLVHSVEEQIARCIIDGKPVDYDMLKDYFMNVDEPEKKAEYVNGKKKKGSEGGIYGVNILMQKFPQAFYELDKNGSSYFIKCDEYARTGIYRLENYMKENPNLRIVDVEKEFFVRITDHLFHGYIDRILYDSNTNEYIIEDIKTKNKLFEPADLKKSLQFVVYAYAVREAYQLDSLPSRFAYDMVFFNERQTAGDPKMMQKGLGTLVQAFDDIQNKRFKPKPSALCHWCEFCETNPNQPEAGRGYCPFYSLWTPNGSAKVWQTRVKWEEGKEEEAIAKFREEIGDRDSSAKVARDFDFSILDKEDKKKDNSTKDNYGADFDF